MDILDKIERAHAMSTVHPERRGTMYAQAADEIKQLRAEVERLTMMLVAVDGVTAVDIETTGLDISSMRIHSVSIVPEGEGFPGSYIRLVDKDKESADD